MARIGSLVKGYAGVSEDVIAFLNLNLWLFQMSHQFDGFLPSMMGDILDSVFGS